MKDSYNINTVKTEKWIMDYLCFGGRKQTFRHSSGIECPECNESCCSD